MGTQAYCLVARKYTQTKPKTIRFLANDSKTNTFDIEEFAEGVSADFLSNNEVNYTSFTSEQGCRELIIQDIESLHDMYCQEENYVFAIRMGGEQHDKVSRQLQSKERCGLVKDILSLALRLDNFELKSGKFTTLKSKNYWRPFEDCLAKRRSERKEVPFFVDFYTDNGSINGGEFPVKLSALIALLREPRIISGIVSKKIVEPLDIIRELLKIAEDRQQEKDDSYLCWHLSSYGNDYDIKRQLRFPGNDDASDGYSIGMLALFILGVFYHVGNFDMTDSAGPVDTVENADNIFALAEKAKELGLDISKIQGGTFETLTEHLIEEELDEEW